LAAFACGVCGLHYEDPAVARACERFCRTNDACSLEITAMSRERADGRSGAARGPIDNRG
jgi:hypothetical protein